MIVSAQFCRPAPLQLVRWASQLGGVVESLGIAACANNDGQARWAAAQHARITFRQFYDDLCRVYPGLDELDTADLDDGPNNFVAEMCVAIRTINRAVDMVHLAHTGMPPDYPEFKDMPAETAKEILWQTSQSLLAATSESVGSLIWLLMETWDFDSEQESGDC